MYVTDRKKMKDRMKVTGNTNAISTGYMIIDVHIDVIYNAQPKPAVNFV